MPSPGHLFNSFALLTLGLCLSSVAHAAEPYEAFIQKHCARCHGPEKEKGDLRFDKLSRDFKLGADTHHWAEAMENVNSGEMPPNPSRPKRRSPPSSRAWTAP